MIIKSILNNSALISLNDRNEEIVLIGKGISFQKHVGDDVDESKIEKVFKRNSKGVDELLELLNNVPNQYFEMTNVIVRYASKKLNQAIDRGIYISLFDHINNTVERYQDGIQLEFGMLEDLKLLYPDIYEVSEWTLDYLNATLDIELPSDEIGFLSVHFLNALKTDIQIENATKIMKIVKEIASLVKEQYSEDFETQGVDFSRFVVHLKYLAVRYLNHEQFNEETLVLNQAIQNETIDVCIDEINNLLTKQYQQELTTYEKDYLVLHLNRLKNNN